MIIVTCVNVIICCKWSWYTLILYSRDNDLKVKDMNEIILTPNNLQKLSIILEYTNMAFCYG